MVSLRTAVLLVAVFSCALPLAQGQECDTTFLDALEGFDTFIFREGLQLAGFEDQLPSPDIGVTILVPTNKAWTSFLFRNGWGFLKGLGSLGDKLVSVMTYHVFPQAFSETTFDTEGSSPTVLSLLAGGDYSVKWWRHSDNQILFQGSYQDLIAGVTDVKQVCNSWIYVVDEVLIPGSSLDDVPTVQLPDTNPFALVPSPPPASPSPPTSDPATGESASPKEKCATTWVDAVKQQGGMSVLAGALGQEGLASQLPDPSEPNTLFAPTDTAFFNALSTLNISINEALALGDKLASAVLYHVVPGAFTEDQLAEKASLPTLLSQNTGADYPITVGKDSAGKVTVSGILPKNTANIVKTFTVCNSQVYVVDEMLFPASSPDELPALKAQPAPTPAPKASPSPADSTSPKPAPLPATPGQQQPRQGSQPQTKSTAIQGVAAGAGYYENCKVELSAPSSSSSSLSAATTNSSGWFELGCEEGACSNASSIWVVRVPGGQSEGCLDTETGIPLLYSLQLTTPGTGALVSLTPVSTLLSLMSEDAGDGGASWEGLRELVAAQLGISLLEAVTEGDPVQGAASGEAAALDVQYASTQLQALVTIGASAFKGALAPGNDTAILPDDLAQAIYRAVGREMQANSKRPPLDLSNSPMVSRVLTSALEDLKERFPDAPEPKADLAEVVAKPISDLNMLAVEVRAEGERNDVDPSRVLLSLQRMIAVAQAEVAPVARQVGEGTLDARAFANDYSRDDLIGLVQKSDLNN